MNHVLTIHHWLLFKIILSIYLLFKYLTMASFFYLAPKIFILIMPHSNSEPFLWNCIRSFFSRFKYAKTKMGKINSSTPKEKNRKSFEQFRFHAIDYMPFMCHFSYIIFLLTHYQHGNNEIIMIQPIYVTLVL